MFHVSIVTFELLLGLHLRHPKVWASSSHPRGVAVAIPVPSAHETPFTSKPTASRGAEIRMVLTQRRDFEWKDTGEEPGEGTTHLTIRGVLRSFSRNTGIHGIEPRYPVCRPMEISSDNTMTGKNIGKPSLPPLHFTYTKQSANRGLALQVGS